MVLDPSPAYCAQLQSRLGIDPSPARSELDRIRKSYLMACASEIKLRLTVDSYSRQLKAFVDFAHNLGITDTAGIETYTLRLFLVYIREERKVGPNTENRYYRCLSAFLNWAVREGHLKDTPLRNVKSPKVPRTTPRPFSADDIQNMLLLCSGQDFLSLRNRAIVLAEMAGVQVGDMDLDTRTIRVPGKGGRERMVRFGLETEKAVLR